MKKEDSTILEELKGTAEDVISQLKAIVKKGNAKRVMVKNRKGKILFQSPLTFSAAGAFFFIVYAPVITALTALAAVASDVSVWVESVAEEEPKEDTYEVDAEVIEIDDEEEGDGADPNKEEGEPGTDNPGQNN